MQQKKQRLFVDMDGTLAEFPTDRSYFEKGFFKSLKPHKKLVAKINSMRTDENVDVFLITTCPQERLNPYAGAEKTAWAERYLPGVKIILLSYGEEKPQGVLRYTGNRVSERDVLLDDYSVNLHGWVKAGGRAIKALNNKNGTKGTWPGMRVNVFEPERLNELLESLGK